MSPALVFSRRHAVLAGGAAALLGLSPASAQPTVNSIRSGGGIAGGGLVDFGASKAQFSVFGSTFVDDEQDAPLIFGSLYWADEAGFTLRSEEIVTYGPDRDDENARLMTGYLDRSDNDNIYAFRLRLVAGSEPVMDSVELLVGGVVESRDKFPELSELDAMLNVKAELSAGDLQLLTFEFPEE